MMGNVESHPVDWLDQEGVKQLTKKWRIETYLIIQEGEMHFHMIHKDIKWKQVKCNEKLEAVEESLRWEAWESHHLGLP